MTCLTYDKVPLVAVYLAGSCFFSAAVPLSLLDMCGVVERSFVSEVTKPYFIEPRM